MKSKVLKKSLLLIVLLAISIVSMVSCSGCNKKKASMAMIPDDASYVMHINLGSIWEKGDFDNLDELTFVKLLRQELKSEDPDAAKTINDLLEDPNSCGLNLKSDIFGFVSESMKVDICLGFQVKDSNKFKDFLKDYADKAKIDLDISTENNYNLAFSKDLNTAFCWDKNKAYAFPIFSEKEASKCADRLMSLQETSSMAQNNDFNTFLKANNDFGFFVNTDKAMRMMDRRELNELGASVDQLKNTSICLGLNFEKGQIKMTSEILGLDDAQTEQFFSTNFNKDLINYLPQQTLAAASVAIKLDPFIRQLEKSKRFNLDESITDGGPSIREFLKSFTGNFAISLSGLSLGGYYNDELKPTFTFVGEINNKRPFTQALSSMEEYGVKNNGDSYTIPSYDVSVNISNNILMVTNESSAINAFSRGGTGNGIEKIASKAQNGNYFYLDLDIDNYPSSLTRQLDKNVVGLIGGYLKEAEARMTGSNSAEIVVSLQNDDENSLEYTLHYIDNNLSRLGRFF